MRIRLESNCLLLIVVLSEGGVTYIFAKSLLALSRFVSSRCLILGYSSCSGYYITTQASDSLSGIFACRDLGAVFVDE